MTWKDTMGALVSPLKACFDLTLAERRFLLGVLLLFALGLGARWLHLRGDRSTPYTPPAEQRHP